MDANGAGNGAEKFILRLVVDNRKGVMARIATLLARKGYNISSICVGKHIEEGEASVVLTIYGTEAELQQAKNMLGKLVNVISIEMLHRGDVVERELCLIKIRGDGDSTESAVKEKASGLQAKIVQRGKGFMVLEVTDYPAKVEEFVKACLKDFEVIDISRSGANAI